MGAKPDQTAIGVGSLIAVTVVWAFSFGLIGKALVDHDPIVIGVIRLLAALLCFAPFLRLRKISPRSFVELAVLGALQFGVMYVCYLTSFQYLEAWQVALFSALTPLWVAAIDAAIRKRFEIRFFLAAALSVTGAVAIRAESVPEGNFFKGFLLMQVANIAFAGGQVWFREWKFRNPDRLEREVFGVLYGGALLFTVLAGLISGSFSQFPQLTSSQWGIVLYLGVVASGLGFFFWNFGASRVSAGFLAASNNLLVPLGVFVAIWINNSKPDWISLSLGSVLIGVSLLLGQKRSSKPVDLNP